MSTAGVITGTPTGPVGTASFTVSVTDSANTPATDTQALSIDIVEPLAITTATLADTSVGVAYNASVVATGGTAPYTFTVSAGSLPDGISISAGGALTGTVLAERDDRNLFGGSRGQLEPTVDADTGIYGARRTGDYDHRAHRRERRRRVHGYAHSPGRVAALQLVLDHGRTARGTQRSRPADGRHQRHTRRGLCGRHFDSHRPGLRQRQPRGDGHAGLAST